MADPDFATFPLVPKGHTFEDFHDGQVFEHHWGRTLNEGDNSLFATVALRFIPLYFNAEYARAHGHPGVVVDPLLVLCTVIGLSVEDLSEAGGPFLGVEDVEFLRPVYPGDTLTARSVVVAKRESERSLSGSSRGSAASISARSSCRLRLRSIMVGSPWTAVRGQRLVIQYPAWETRLPSARGSGFLP